MTGLCCPGATWYAKSESTPIAIAADLGHSKSLFFRSHTPNDMATSANARLNAAAAVKAVAVVAVVVVGVIAHAPSRVG